MGLDLAVLLFLTFYAFHLLRASQLYQAGDLISQGWASGNGWDFVIATARWNVALHPMPSPVVALAICVALIGLSGSRDERALRAAVITVGYMVGLSVFGRVDNYYWGELITPLIPT